jgi:hypothetical protein
LCAALLAAWLAWWFAEPWRNDFVAPTPIETRAAANSDAPTAVSSYLGSPSCAAARCHGAQYDPERPAWSWGYTLWRADDPHARAYADLLSTRGQEIAQRYFIGEPAVRAESDQRCVVCHLTPETPLDAALSEGVGCESCHGASRAWRNEHYLADWKAKRAAEGFQDLRKLDQRAKSCVPCHVGAVDREVNHDLIAAGHPALRFELGAFHEQLPKHWDAAGEKRDDPHWEARLWLAG